MRYAYYDNLKASEKRSYRRSDAIATIPLPDGSALARLAAAVEQALAEGSRASTRRACERLVAELSRQLGAPRVEVVVHDVRPREDQSELHGQYTYEEGVVPTIEVWMRTAAHRNVVAYRTFLRTLLHEVVHHLDVTTLGLEHTFHTEGFFRRESDLVRQLAARRQPAAGDGRAAKAKRRGAPAREQSDRAAPKGPKDQAAAPAKGKRPAPKQPRKGRASATGTSRSAERGSTKSADTDAETAARDDRQLWLPF